MTTLGALLEQLDGLNDEDTFFARRPWSAGSQAVVAEEGAELANQALDTGLVYLMEVAIAKDVIATWTSWRAGELPTLTQACDAILHYATHDSYLPL